MKLQTTRNKLTTKNHEKKHKVSQKRINEGTLTLKKTVRTKIIITMTTNYKNQNDQNNKPSQTENNKK